MSENSQDATAASGGGPAAQSAGRHLRTSQELTEQVRADVDTDGPADRSAVDAAEGDDSAFSTPDPARGEAPGE